MKLLHLSDLHLGKRVNAFSQIEDQKFILKQILTIVSEESPDAVLICGDVYDKSVPSAEAVELFDAFLTELSKSHTDVFIISGNHDSAERIAFGGKLFSAAHVYVSPVYDGHVTTIDKEDEFGTVRFYLLPFLKPSHVRLYYPDAAIDSYTDAIRTALSGCEVSDHCRHVLLTHQLVTGAERSESEELSIGGTDNVDLQVFDGFDYVALGHLHRPQNVGSERVRYCGTPLKYAFSESSHNKSVTLVDLQEKGNIQIRTIPLSPLRDLVELKGSFAELTNRDFYLGSAFCQSYLHITLTDEDDVPDAIGKLRAIYPYIMRLDYDNQRTRYYQNPMEEDACIETTPLQLFAQLYEKQNNQPMSAQQETFMENLIHEIWEAEP